MKLKEKENFLSALAMLLLKQASLRRYAVRFLYD